MEYPDYIYVASVDPMHYSHLNTIREAEKALGKAVYLVICRNDLKNEGLFSIEERLTIARHYLGGKKIYCAKNLEEVRQYLLRAKKIVRGIRDSEDTEYIDKLAKHYNVAPLFNKLKLIKVPEELINISSTRIKEMTQKGYSEEASGMVHPEVFAMLKKKLQVTT